MCLFIEGFPSVACSIVETIDDWPDGPNAILADRQPYVVRAHAAATSGSRLKILARASRGLDLESFLSLHKPEVIAWFMFIQGANSVRRSPCRVRGPTCHGTGNGNWLRMGSLLLQVPSPCFRNGAPEWRGRYGPPACVQQDYVCCADLRDSVKWRCYSVPRCALPELWLFWTRVMMAVQE